MFSNKGPDLYGTEPISYYLKNLFLNFNFIFIFALVSLPVALLVEAYFRRRIGESYNSAATTFIFYLAPLYLWLGIFFSQPHKEERFLFPVYPFIAFGGAVFISSIQKIYKISTDEIQNLKFLPDHFFIQKLAIVVTLIFSISRILANIFGFIGILNLYSNSLQLLGSNLEVDNHQQYTLCLGKEWHRFNTNFLTPKNLKIEFIQSEFKGQLPGKFIGTWPVSIYDDIKNRDQIRKNRQISALRQKFNDDNLEEEDRYVEIDTCDFIIDRIGEHVPKTQLEPDFTLAPYNYEVLYSHSIINLQNSPVWSRTFYLPYVFEKFNVFNEYVILMKPEE